MTILLDWLLKAQFALTALIALNVVLAARPLFGGTGKLADLGIALALLAVFGGFAAGAWWLQQHATPRAALAVLAGFWVLVVISVIVAASQARWN